MKANKFGLVLTAAALCISAVGVMNIQAADEDKNPVTVVAYNQAETAHYDVVKRDAKATINGKLDEKVWESVPSISGSSTIHGKLLKLLILNLKLIMTGLIFISVLLLKIHRY